jgi:hypothetical protein
VAYVTSGRVVGISKLARVVEVYAKRLQIQEKMMAQIANSINDVLKPQGVAVIIKASTKRSGAVRAPSGKGEECLMLVRSSTAIAAICLLSGAAFAQGAAKPTDPQIAHIAYTAGQLDIEAA